MAHNNISLSTSGIDDLLLLITAGKVFSFNSNNKTLIYEINDGKIFFSSNNSNIVIQILNSNGYSGYHIGIEISRSQIPKFLDFISQSLEFCFSLRYECEFPLQHQQQRLLVENILLNNKVDEKYQVIKRENAIEIYDQMWEKTHLMFISEPKELYLNNYVFNCSFYPEPELEHMMKFKIFCPSENIEKYSFLNYKNETCFEKHDSYKDFVCFLSNSKNSEIISILRLVELDSKLINKHITKKIKI